MKKILLLFSFLTTFCFSQNIRYSKFTADNGVEYKTGETLEYQGEQYKIKKIHKVKKTGKSFFTFKELKEPININKAIEECLVKPCEIVPEIKYNCEYSKNEVDEFTGQELVFTKDVALFSRFPVETNKFYAGKTPSGTEISLHFQVSNPDIFSLEEGKQLMILFEDKSVEKMSVTNSVTAEAQYNHGVTFWYAWARVIATPSFVEKLSESRATKLRVYTRDSKTEVFIDADRSHLMYDSIKCIEIKLDNKVAGE